MIAKEHRKIGLIQIHIDKVLYEYSIYPLMFQVGFIYYNIKHTLF